MTDFRVFNVSYMEQKVSLCVLPIFLLVVFIVLFFVLFGVFRMNFKNEIMLKRIPKGLSVLCTLYYYTKKNI